ncbi:hypothetical protein FDZ71_01775 [bacterium]|nr:MAG: hypothetical protein FDZ71_01775 [bacterium]
MSVLFVLFVSVFVVALVVLSAVGRLADEDSMRGHLTRYGQAHLPLVFMGFLGYHLYYMLTLWGSLMHLVGAQLGIDILQHAQWNVNAGVLRFLIHLVQWCGFYWTLFLIINIARQKKGFLFAFLLHSIAALFITLFFIAALDFHFFKIPYF